MTVDWEKEDNWTRIEDPGIDASEHIKEIHRRLLAEGEEMLRNFIPVKSGTIEKLETLGVKIKHVYSIVNGVKQEFPIHVNEGDAVSMVLVTDWGEYTPKTASRTSSSSV